MQASILRLNALSEFGNLVADIVVVGEGRAEVGLLIFPPGKMQTGTKGDVVLNENYQRQIAEVLGILATRASGSSQRIARALVMAEPPDHGAGEVTAKGSLNVQNIVMRRSDLLDRLYEDTDTGVIHVQG